MKILQFVAAAVASCFLAGCLPEDEGPVMVCASQGLQRCSGQLQAAARSGTAQDVYRWYLFNLMYTKGDDAALRMATKRFSGLLNCAAIGGYEPAVEHAEIRLEYLGRVVDAPPAVTRHAFECLESEKNSFFGGSNRWMNCSAYKVLPVCPAEFRSSAK